MAAQPIILAWRNPMDRGTWWATVHVVAKSWTWQSPERLNHSTANFRASLVAQLVKNLPAMQETWVRSLDWEDPLEEGMATHSSILAWRNPMDRGAWPATIHRVTKSQTQLWLKLWATKRNTFVYLSPLLECELLQSPKGVLCSRSLMDALKQWMDKQYRTHNYLT